MQLTFGNMTMELNIFHLNNKHELLETENQISDEVVSIGQCAGKQSTQEVQGVISQEDEEILVLPTTPTASQLINSKAISKDHFNNWAPNTMEPAPANAWVEEIILLDPPLSNFEIELVRCFQKPNCSSTIFTFCLKFVNLDNFSYFSKILNLAVFHILVLLFTYYSIVY